MSSAVLAGCYAITQSVLHSHDPNSFVSTWTCAWQGLGLRLQRFLWFLFFAVHGSKQKATMCLGVGMVAVVISFNSRYHRMLGTTPIIIAMANPRCVPRNHPISARTTEHNFLQGFFLWQQLSSPKRRRTLAWSAAVWDERQESNEWPNG